MQKSLTLFFGMLVCSGLLAQTTATFEDFNLTTGQFLNGSDGSGGFTNGHVLLLNSYNDAWQSWSGWAISAATDTETPGFMNQYSSITGGGYEGSTTYAVAYATGRGSVLKLEGAAAGGLMQGMYITNGTYPYLSMRDGDGFAKKFGGETGDDPDFLLLTIKKYLNGELSVDSVDFYLADYRFTDHAQDYIVKDWTYLDLSSLGNADSLLFSLSSTDNSQYGMNTPAYFCVDDITTADQVISATSDIGERLDDRIFPNPATDYVVVDWKEIQAVEMAVFDVNGRQVRRFRLRQGNNRLDISQLPQGMYFMQLVGRLGMQSAVLMKTGFN